MLPAMENAKDDHRVSGDLIADHIGGAQNLHYHLPECAGFIERSAHMRILRNKVDALDQFGRDDLRKPRTGWLQKFNEAIEIAKRQSRPKIFSACSTA